MSYSKARIIAHAVGSVTAPPAPARSRPSSAIVAATSATSAWALDEFDLAAPMQDAWSASAAEHSAAAQLATREADLELRLEALVAERAVLVAEAEQRGYAAGHQAGLVAGADAAADQLMDIARALSDGIAQVTEREKGWTQALEDNVCALAITVARQVIGRELRGGDVVLDLVRRALTEFPLDQGVKVRLHPMDLASLNAASGLDGKPVEVAPDRDVTWIADASLTRGGCVVEGRERIVDGRVDTALDRIYRTLTQHDA